MGAGAGGREKGVRNHAISGATGTARWGRGLAHPLADASVAVLHHGLGVLAAELVHEDVPEDVQLCGDRPTSASAAAVAAVSGALLTDRGAA